VNDPFSNLPAHVATFDGRNDTFMRPLEFTVNGKRYRIPIGSTTDGLSSPKIFWIVLPPWGQKTWGPSTAHDAGYRGTLEVWENGRWRKLHSSEYWDDKLLLHLLKANGVNLFLRYTIYYVLRALGWIAFKADRKQLTAG